MLLRCVECGCWSDAEARGWAGFISGGPADDDDEAEAVYLYCPSCATLEFGYRSKRGETQT